MALGATAGQGMKAVVTPGIMLAASGLFAGTGASLGATRLLSSLLVGA
jgi:hypothetical protein